jgi:hypothetical protein
MITAITAKFILTFSAVCRYIIHMGKKHHNTLELVIEAQRRGIDLDRILQEMLYPNPDS